jgi:signal transduction histidine kinase
MTRTAGVVGSDLAELLAVLAHDIRSPLHTLGLSCELLASRIDLSDAASARQLENVRHAIRQIDRLLADVLTMASDQSAGRAASGACVAWPVVAEGVEDHRALAEAKGIGLSVRLAHEHCVVGIDRASLLRVLANLLTNAIRFTPAGGHVDVRVERLDEEVVLQVRDSGCGIPVDRLPHVFERAPLDHRERRGGGGFGLSIVRGIAESCGGRVGAESAVGKGSSFTVLLPVVARAGDVRQRTPKSPAAAAVSRTWRTTHGVVDERG